jgi:hypothetical protein
MKRNWEEMLSDPIDGERYTKMSLTKRGRRVRAGLLTALLLAIIWLLNDATTPDQCKVEFENLSQFCLDLLYK